MTSTVSVIVPVYNSEAYISKCLDNIINQSYQCIEIIIINDGSTDKTEQIVEKYKEKDHRIVYYYQENSGPSEARNKGIINANGEYIIFIDADDSIVKNYVELLLTKIKSLNSDLVCCGYKDISVYGIQDCLDFPFSDNESLHTVMGMACEGTGGVLWSKIYKKEIIEKYKLLMDKRIYMCEDLVFNLQYMSYCKSFAVINEHLYSYNRLNENSISSNISINDIQNYIIVWESIEKILNSVNYGKEKSEKLIEKKILQVIIDLIDQQSNNIKEDGIKYCILNIQEILKKPKIEEYKNNFNTDNFFYKPYIFLVKRNCVRLVILYSIQISLLKKLKRKLNKKKILSN